MQSLSTLSNDISSNINIDEVNKCADAALRNDLNALKLAHEDGIEWEDTTSCAAYSGSLECLKYAHENGASFDENTLSEAIQYGHLDCFDYAYQNGAPFPDNIAICSVLSGDINCVRHVLRFNLKFTPRDAKVAIRNGYLDILKLIMPLIGELPKNAYRHACSNATPEMMAYLNEHGAVPLNIYNPSYANKKLVRYQMREDNEPLFYWNLCSELAYHGRIEALDYVLENKICGFDQYACLAACLGGSLITLRCLRELGVDWGTYDHKRWHRVLQDSYKCFIYALEHGAPWTGLPPLTFGCELP